MRSTRLSDRAVADMIKRRAAAVGLDGLFAERFDPASPSRPRITIGL
jgi:hypothetical protein